MARCGCDGACACVLSVDASLNLTGNGSVDSPWLLKAVPDCDATMACIDGRADEPMEVNAGRLSVKVSTDSGQVLTTGTDGGLLVPGVTAGASHVGNTDSVSLAGTGISGDPILATWLGAQLNNVPDTGVQLSGDGTAGNPLHVNWNGISIASVAPEVNVSGLGTAASPLTVRWAGLPWNKFSATNMTIANAVNNFLVPWSPVAGGQGNVIIISGASPSPTLLCQRSGAYIFLMRLRFFLSNTASTTSGGYFQATLTDITTSAMAFDTILNTYGGSWVDINVTESVQMVNAQTYHLSVYNNTGSGGVNGAASMTFFRISD
jgi:hypothetical protein